MSMSHFRVECYNGFCNIAHTEFTCGELISSFEDWIHMNRAVVNYRGVKTN